MSKLFYRFVDYLRYQTAIERAESEHNKQGKRFYVMPVTESKTPKLIIMDRKNFRMLKSKKYIDHKACLHTLMQESVYFTAHGNGSGFLDEEGKRKKYALYKSYCDAVRYGKRKQ